ncbi:metal ABC transporter permease [Millisia brevis]|uniref:metal ABC transporter permease n=1 Tax=Millisia brevis TaxID=264148 RepID=UPI000829E2CF|nr:metal ABC transporter permease [Millisia brevis]
MSFAAGVAALSIVTAIACAIPGVFVVLRRNSMLVDAVSHAILPGIVVGFWLTRDLESPVLLVGAALSGLLVVLGSEALGRTGLLAGDAPQGLIFPALFSIGVLMVSARFADVHLDTHAVLVGDPNLIAFDRWYIGGVSIGPSYLYLMLAVLVINAAFVGLLWRRLEVTTFDPEFARVSGIRTGLLNMALMLLVSITVTAAFNAAGAILVVALMIAPPATALLISRRLTVMVAWTVVIAAVGALGGFLIAYYLDAATAAGMSVFYGAIFVAVLVGTVAQRRRGHPARVAVVEPEPEPVRA